VALAVELLVAVVVHAPVLRWNAAGAAGIAGFVADSGR
jgi:hypothetical protein